MTEKLTDLVLDPEGKVLRGDGNSKEKPHSRINKEELSKSLEVLQGAIENFSFAGYDWKSTIVNPEKSSVKIGTQEFENRTWTDNEELHGFYDQPFTRKRRSNLSERENQYLSEAEFLNQHIDFRKHSITFQRCRDDLCGGCQEHRKRHPLPDGWWEKTSLPSRKDGALFFVPEFHDKDKNSYKSYLTHVKDQRRGGKKYRPDKDLESGEIKRCRFEDDGCLYTFTSTAAAERHMGVAHNLFGEFYTKL